MTTNELMRHLLTDISDEDQRHLVEVVDRNHAEQLARKRHAPMAPDADGREQGGFDSGDESRYAADSWDDDSI